MPAKFASVASRHTTVRPANVISAPARSATSSGRSSFTGNRRSSSVLIISVPTMPAAPTTATFHSLSLTRASLKPRHDNSSAFGSGLEAKPGAEGREPRAESREPVLT